MADEALLEPRPAESVLRTDAAVMIARVKIFSSTGVLVRFVDIKVDVNDPALTTQQRNGLINVIKQMAQFKGLIA